MKYFGLIVPKIQESWKYEIVTLYITDDSMIYIPWLDTRQPIYNIFACIIISLKPKLMHYVFFRHLVMNKYKCLLWYRNSPLLYCFIMSRHGTLHMPAKNFCFLKRIKTNIYNRTKIFVQEFILFGVYF